VPDDDGCGAAQRVEYAAAAEGALGGLVAQDHAVAMHRMGWRIEQQLRVHVATGRQAFAFEQGDAAGDILGAEVDVHRRPVAQFAGFAG